MDAITLVQGVAVPLGRTNVDTDQIVPSRFLKRVTRSGFGDALFAEWRSDPNFVLNQPAYADAKILVAGEDFGTGSSREHAVWALHDYGFRAVISSRFADIFRGNAGKQGLLTAEVSQANADALLYTLEHSPGATLSVDLESRTITSRSRQIPFQIDDYTRWRLLKGLDDVDLTLQQESHIRAFEGGRPLWMPSVRV